MDQSLENTVLTSIGKAYDEAARKAGWRNRSRLVLKRESDKLFDSIMHLVHVTRELIQTEQQRTMQQQQRRRTPAHQGGARPERSRNAREGNRRSMGRFVWNSTKAVVSFGTSTVTTIASIVTFFQVNPALLNWIVCTFLKHRYGISEQMENDYKSAVNEANAKRKVFEKLKRNAKMSADQAARETFAALVSFNFWGSLNPWGRWALGHVFEHSVAQAEEMLSGDDPDEWTRFYVNKCMKRSGNTAAPTDAGGLLGREIATKLNELGQDLRNMLPMQAQSLLGGTSLAALGAANGSQRSQAQGNASTEMLQITGVAPAPAGSEGVSWFQRLHELIGGISARISSQPSQQNRLTYPGGGQNESAVSQQSAGAVSGNRGAAQRIGLRSNGLPFVGQGAGGLGVGQWEGWPNHRGQRELGFSR